MVSFTASIPKVNFAVKNQVYSSTLLTICFFFFLKKKCLEKLKETNTKKMLLQEIEDS